MTHSPHSQSGCDDMLLGRLKRGLFQPHWDLFAVLRFLIEGSFERSANQVCDKKVIINLHQGRTNCAREWVSLQKLGACRFPLSSPKPLFTPSVCLLSFNFLRVVKGWHTSQFHYPLQMHHFIIIELFVRAWIPWKRNILLYYNIFFFTYICMWCGSHAFFCQVYPPSHPWKESKRYLLVWHVSVCTRHHCASVNAALWAGSPRYISFYLSPLPLTCSVVVSPRASLDRDNAPAVGRLTFISFISTEMGIYQMPLPSLIVMEHVER